MQHADDSYSRHGNFGRSLVNGCYMLIVQEVGAGGG